MIRPTLPRVAAALLALAALALGQARGSNEPRPGEHCRVCGRELEANDHVELYRGRRVPLCAGACTQAFESDRDAWLASLQPRAALFQEADPGHRTGVWFWIGIAVVLSLVSAAACAWLAVNRGQPPLGWFFAGLAGNVAAVVVVAFLLPRADLSSLPGGLPRGLAKVPSTRRPAPCPECGRYNHPAATACSSCGHALSASAPSEVAEAAR